MEGFTAVNPGGEPGARSYLRSMSTYDDIWIPEHDAWGVDRLAWEDDQDDEPRREDEAAESGPDDPRY